MSRVLIATSNEAGFNSMVSAVKDRELMWNEDTKKLFIKSKGEVIEITNVYSVGEGGEIDLDQFATKDLLDEKYRDLENKINSETEARKLEDISLNDRVAVLEDNSIDIIESDTEINITDETTLFIEKEGQEKPTFIKVKAVDIWNYISQKIKDNISLEDLKY